MRCDLGPPAHTLLGIAQPVPAEKGPIFQVLFSLQRGQTMSWGSRAWIMRWWASVDSRTPPVVRAGQRLTRALTSSSWQRPTILLAEASPQLSAQDPHITAGVQRHLCAATWQLE